MLPRYLIVLIGFWVLLPLGGLASHIDYMRTMGECEWITANQPIYIDPPAVDGVTGYTLDYASVVFIGHPSSGTVELDKEGYMKYIPNTTGIVHDQFQYEILDTYGFVVTYRVEIEKRCHVVVRRLGREVEKW